MRIFLSQVILCLVILLIKTPTTFAQEATVQVVLAAEMPDIADPKQGSYAQLKRLIEDERKRVPTTFFLFGGGSIGPSALSNLDRGSHIIDILNSLEPDAMGAAKREFSFGVDELSLRSYEAAFPIVASNLIDKRLNAVPDGLVDGALITRNDVTLGFISIYDKRLLEEYLLSDIIIVKDKETKIRGIANELRKAGADIVILQYFNDFPEIVKLLDDQAIDYAFVSVTRTTDEYKKQLGKDNRIFVADKPGQAIIASFEANTNFPLVSLKKVDLINLSVDPLVENQVNSYLLRLNRLLNDNIAYWDGFYSTSRDEVRGKENAFANFVVDAMRDFGKADIALINGGSIRGDTTYKQNTQITRRTIATELPYRSTLSVISVSGQQLTDALEVGFAGLDILKGTFPQISGMQVEFDSSAPHGERVLSVLINGQQLDTNKQYRLATTNYLAAGGDGYASLSIASKQTTSAFDKTILIADLVLQTLRIKGKLDSKIEQRIVDKASQP
ncbi:MAG: 2',3'-cyclic-nucleotide 2'-phosphodiesterase (5'-nucleotidase family) [Alphaproteobacteria bacterium]|jgi:2',3'-cyclic-nucleotide 2'-phosphodiesterase (5'-nucleotidase family)